MVDKFGIENRLFRDAVLIFAIGLILFTIGWGQTEFINHEIPYALLAQSFFKHGANLFSAPLQLSSPSYLAYLSSLPMSSLSRFAVIFPTAICSALTLSLVYLIAAPHSRQWGFCGALFALFTVFFISHARSITADQMLITVTTACFYLAYSQDILLQSKRVLWLPVLLILGFWIRGPLGLIVPACVVASYYVLTQRWRYLLTLIVSATFLLVILSLLFISFAAESIAVAQFKPDFNWPSIFYVKNSFTDFAISAPIAVIVILGNLTKLFKTNLDRHLKLLVFCIAWALVVLILFSILAHKNTQYILSITPAASLIAAYIFIQDKHRQTRWLYWLRKVLDCLFFIFPFICALLVLLGKNLSTHRFHVIVDVHFTAVFIILLLLQIAAIVYGFARQRARKESMWLLSATLAFVAVNIMVVEPSKLLIGQSRPFVQQVQALRANKPGPLVFYQISPKGLALNYQVNLNHKLHALYVTQSQSLLTLPSNAYIVTTKPSYNQLPANIKDKFHILYEHRFGHKRGLVLTQTQTTT